ncbi:auxin-responsive protein SAUR22-like [Malania oleifera]|uniref:auxin-responsive protein SAUR22-like n=1 Tax=Malania oleifera TaxID=397392 RepID=UPI0025AE86F2|nr:auxin-responsive protein SAUR22-like [Malania oleifera]
MSDDDAAYMGKQKKKKKMEYYTKKLAKMVGMNKVLGGDDAVDYLDHRRDADALHRHLLLEYCLVGPTTAAAAASPSGCGGGGTTPPGFVAIYVGEERRRFVVPTGHLSHPLFRMLLEKAGDEFGFAQKSGLVVPCTVSAFRDVVAAVQSCRGNFDLGKLMEEELV